MQSNHAPDCPRAQHIMRECLCDPESVAHLPLLRAQVQTLREALEGVLYRGRHEDHGPLCGYRLAFEQRGVVDGPGCDCGYWQRKHQEARAALSASPPAERRYTLAEVEAAWLREARDDFGLGDLTDALAKLP